MGEVTRLEVIAHLEAAGERRDVATQYADAYLEYRQASENIDRFGTIVQHPRTATPIENPYLVVRDRALKKLRGMRGVKAAGLW